jgi:hypothetical protein
MNNGRVTLVRKSTMFCCDMMHHHVFEFEMKYYVAKSLAHIAVPKALAIHLLSTANMLY